jgi:hypothetical protein
MLKKWFVFVVLIVVLCTFWNSNVQSQKKEFPSITKCSEHPLEELDKIVQTRFLDTKDRFGMLRMVAPNSPKHFPYFTPENDQEAQIIDALAGQSYKVGFFLVGRKLLLADEKLLNHEKKRNNPPTDISKSIFRRPLGVTIRRFAEKELPESSEILVEAREGFKRFDEKVFSDDAIQFTRGGWNYFIRPVLASEQKCVDCHNQRREDIEGLKSWKKDRVLKLNDPLGILIYSYKVEKKKTKQDDQ